MTTDTTKNTGKVSQGDGITEHEESARSSHTGPKIKQIHEIESPKECTADAERYNKLLWYLGGIKDS